MASKPSNEEGGEGGEGANVIPPSVVAQAEAAILGNFENGSAPISRQHTRASRASRPSFSRHHTDQRPSEGSSRASHLQVPNILSTMDILDAPPAYGREHDQIEVSQDGFDTKAKITDDGRINININQKTRKLSDLLVPALRNQLSLVAQEEAEHPLPPGYIPPALGGLPGQTLPPKLNVVMHVVGSRGDVQPFVALGKTLKATYGHRVRLATHPTFKNFVEENGLEFFSIGGDPSELMAFMVKNPGLMPGMDSLKSGDVGKRREGMEGIVLGCWRSCIEAGDGLGAPSQLGSGEFDAGIKLDCDASDRPFIADAIIANPPSFAHIHIAEKMGIPLHMMFTMPWSPTQQFPHPLANIQSSNADVNMTNFVSYALVEMMTWQGLGDVINRFRERALGLDPISLIWAPGMLSRLKVPYTYCWSPALIPKPKDWGQHISISGFYFLSLASSFTPEPELEAYLQAGPPPVYIGFGSIVVDDPDAMTKMIFEAVKKAGVRALVSKGWGGLGADTLGIPDGVFMLGNVPHDWLFQHVSAVVHHGGAGTTAAGIATGKPTVVVPFFGDQPFWGAMVARAGAGPVPIPYKQLTADKLAAAILEALNPETLERAKELGAKIKEEKGTEMGGKSFHDMLNFDELRCSVSPSRAAVWRVKRTQTRLSAVAANILSSEGLIDFADLKLHRPREYETEDGPWDPITGGASALLGTIASLSMGIADFPIEIFRAVKKQAAKKHDGNNATKDGTSGSGENTPSASTPRNESQLDLSADDASTSRSTTTSGKDTDSSTPKTSYEGTMRSDISDMTTSPTTITSTSSFNQQAIDAFRKDGIEGLKQQGMSSLKQALRGTLNRSRSGSRDRTSSRSGSRHRACSPFSSREPEKFDPSQLTLKHVTRAGKGISRIVGAGLKSPMDFTLGLARGFHNAPKLYGDDTVRPQEKVTDFQSGLKAAGREFGFGMFDGITGLVTQPMRGAEQEGAVGLVKGIGKGIGGLILKPGAAIWGIPGYTFMGIHKEIRKMFGSSILNYVISVRTAQGYEEAQRATPQERQEVIARWHEYKEEYQNSKTKTHTNEDGTASPKGISSFMQTRHMTFDERKERKKQKKLKREAERKENGNSTSNGRNCPFCRRDAPHDHTPRTMQTTPIVPSTSHSTIDEDTNSEFERAIRASVAATSRGNYEEDAVIERAIRASVRELQRTSGDGMSDEEALNKAIQASVAEAGRRPQDIGFDRDQKSESGIPISDEEREQQEALEKAIQESLRMFTIRSSTIDDGDEELKLALERSKSDGLVVDEDEALKTALENSKTDVGGAKAKTEEEIVLEYVLKQSLLEEEGRGRKGVAGKAIERRMSEGIVRKPVLVRTATDTSATEPISGQVARTHEQEERGRKGSAGKAIERKMSEGIVGKPVPVRTATDTSATEPISGQVARTQEQEESAADEEALRMAIEESLKVSGEGGGGDGSRV